MRLRARVLLYIIAASVNIFSTMLPVWPWRYLILARRLHFPLPLILGAQDLTLLIGVAMLLLAYPAARGHRRSARLLMLCAGLGILSNLVKGLDVEEALLDVALLASLWRARRALTSFPIRYTPLDVARLAVVLLVVGKLYALAGQALLDGLSDLVHERLRSVPVLHHIQVLLTAKLALQSLWFAQSTVVLPVFLIAIFVYISWSSVLPVVATHQQRVDYYGRYGRASHNSLAYLARRSDVRTFVAPSGAGAMSYRQIGRVALQIGAVLAPPAERAAVYAQFRAFCRAQHLVPAAVALSREERPCAEAAGLRTLMIGTEAVVDLAGFAAARLSKKMRWVERSLARRGYAVELVAPDAITPTQRAVLARIDGEWRAARGGQDHGCCMTLGRFPRADEPECVIGLMRDARGEPVAYLTLLPGGDGYHSLDLTRRASTAPNAATEFLLMETLRQLRERDASAVSLNFSTLSWLRTSAMGQVALRLVGSAFQLDSLETFNNKFRPTWVPRYIAFPSWLALPDVVYAIVVVEGVHRMALNAGARLWRSHAGRPAMRPTSATAGGGPA